MWYRPMHIDPRKPVRVIALDIHSDHPMARWMQSPSNGSRHCLSSPIHPPHKDASVLVVCDQLFEFVLCHLCFSITLLTVMLRASISSIFFMAHILRCPCQPRSAPWWQVLHRATTVYCLCCLTWWASDGPRASQTEQGSSFTSATYLRSAAVRVLFTRSPSRCSCCWRFVTSRPRYEPGRLSASTEAAPAPLRRF